MNLFDAYTKEVLNNNEFFDLSTQSNVDLCQIFLSDKCKKINHNSQASKVTAKVIHYKTLKLKFHLIISTQFCVTLVNAWKNNEN
ncbi:hypothetical protein CVS40_3712 [Lucilia cuprina]|nr:hypothetical protein CVS40_3712 [Lucilia cuprina]